MNTSLIHISENGEITLHLTKDDLQFAQGISADQCPKPNLQHGLSVFELYNYDENQPEAFTTNTFNHKKRTKLTNDMSANKTNKDHSKNKETEKRPEGVFTLEELVDSLKPEVRRKLKSNANKN